MDIVILAVAIYLLFCCNHISHQVHNLHTELEQRLARMEKKQR